MLIRKNIPINAACGGQGRCGQCRVKVKGRLSTPDEIESVLIPARLLKSGYRLACRCMIHGKPEIFVPPFKKPGYRLKAKNQTLGLALDLGTTVIKGALVNLKSGEVLQRAKLYNPQNSLGNDVITRISASIEGKEKKLNRLLFSGIKEIHKQLGIKRPVFTTVVGNTVMLSFYLKKSVKGLAQFPFESEIKKATILKHPARYIFPVIGGFVGGDTIAGILASQAYKGRDRVLYIDLGTNGEIALISKKRVLALSAAAGPAFEGVGIEYGSLAVAGAIDQVQYRGGFRVHTIENRKPVGLCASGLIDLIAVLLNLGWLREDGRLLKEFEYKGIRLTQKDVRKLQLAIGAIHTGVQVILEHTKSKPRDLAATIITGEFGGNLNLKSLMRTGVIPDSLGKVRFETDLPLQGAIRALLDDQTRNEIDGIARNSEHVELADQADFSKKFITALKLKPWS